MTDVFEGMTTLNAWPESCARLGSDDAFNDATKSINNRQNGQKGHLTSENEGNDEKKD